MYQACCLQSSTHQLKATSPTLYYPTNNRHPTETKQIVCINKNRFFIKTWTVYLNQQEQAVYINKNESFMLTTRLAKKLETMPATTQSHKFSGNATEYYSNFFLSLMLWMNLKYSNHTNSWEILQYSRMERTWTPLQQLVCFSDVDVFAYLAIPVIAGIPDSASGNCTNCPNPTCVWGTMKDETCALACQTKWDHAL